MSWFSKLVGGLNEEDKKERPFRYDKIRQMAVVLDDPENETLLSARDFISTFKGIQKNILIYKSGEKKVDNFISGMEFDEKSFDWMKKPKKKEELYAFLQTEYDLLIDYSKGKNSLVDWVVENTSARLKIGNSDKDIYDFKIITEGEEDFESYNQEMSKYLSLINNVEWDEEEWEALEAQEWH